MTVSVRGLRKALVRRKELFVDDWGLCGNLQPPFQRQMTTALGASLDGWMAAKFSSVLGIRCSRRLPRGLRGAALDHLRTVAQAMPPRDG